MNKLIKFLKQQRVLRKFKKNFACDKLTISNDLKAFCTRTPQVSYIARAFTWDDTPEKHEFWKPLNDKWKASL